MQVSLCDSTGMPSENSIKHLRDLMVAVLLQLKLNSLLEVVLIFKATWSEVLLVLFKFSDSGRFARSFELLVGVVL